MPFSTVRMILLLFCLALTTNMAWSFFSSYSTRTCKVCSTRATRTRTTQFHRMVSSGFSFEDGEQILVSVQKPLGIVLEQDVDGPIVVTEVDPTGSAGRAGVQVGYVLVAVQNASVKSADLDSVLDFIQTGPRVMNLRLMRGSA
jgi:C-terminal processing protease CtpA/Prc